ncbi:MAG TPA: hypothetical protein VLT35_04830 [Methanocella sp.]|nr:hypothetical protein [Methanocella sp.]
MDLTGSLYGVFGVSEPLYLAIAGLVAVLLAGSLSATVLEAARIYREYAGVPPRARLEKEAGPALPAKEEQAPEPGKIYITNLADVAAHAPGPTPQAPAPPAQPTAPPGPLVTPSPPTAAPSVEVVKDTLPESMRAITAKYGLEWLTIASGDGLVIASTSPTPDEDAAVYSNLFYELYRTRPEGYFNVANKDIHLLSVESGGHRFIDVARKPGQMTKGEAAGLREDSRKIVERFGRGGKIQR